MVKLRLYFAKSHAIIEEMGKSVKAKKKNIVVKAGAGATKAPGTMKDKQTKQPTAEKPIKVRVFEAGVAEEAASVDLDALDGAESVSVAEEMSETRDKNDDAQSEKNEETVEVEEEMAVKALPAGVVSAEEAVEITKMKKPGRKSMSGMVVEIVKHPETSEATNENAKQQGEDASQGQADNDGQKEGDQKDGERKAVGAVATEASGEPRFSQAKSALIGVGVAVAVAVIGFIGIGIFSGDQRKCTVLFDSNGGTEVAGTEIVCGKAVMEPERPTKEGFSFQGWALEGDPFDFSKMTVYNNAVLVARWAVDEGTETVKVKFDTAGGSEMSAIELAKGATLSEPVRRPTRSGYTFGGWYVGSERYEFGRPVESDLTLTAHWVKVQTPNNQPSDRPTENPGNQEPGGNETPEPEEVAVAELSVANVGKEAGSGEFEVAVGVFPGDATYELEVGGGSAVASCKLKGGNVLACTVGEAGEATITVKDKKSGKETSFMIKVNPQEIEPTGITVTGAQTVEVRKTLTLVATLAPEGATGEVSWSSSDTNIATVVGGVVTGVKAGDATIKATIKSGDKEYSAELKVTVTEVTNPPVGGDTGGGEVKPPETT